MNAAWKTTVDQAMGAFSDEADGLDKDSPLIMFSDRDTSSSKRDYAFPHCLWADVSTFCPEPPLS